MLNGLLLLFYFPINNININIFSEAMYYKIKFFCIISEKNTCFFSLS